MIQILEPVAQEQIYRESYGRNWRKWVAYDGDTGLWNGDFFKEEREEEQTRIKMVIEPPKIEPGIYQCRRKKCRSWETGFQVIQTRGCDEGGTQFIVCFKCGWTNK